MVKKCKPHDPVILIDVAPRETFARYRLFIAELFVVIKHGNKLHVLQ